MIEVLGRSRCWGAMASSAVVALAAPVIAQAAEPASSPRVVADPSIRFVPQSGAERKSEYDWTGPFVSIHTGYSGGNSTISSASSIHSMSLTHGYNIFKGTGSYDIGVGAGFNYMLPSRVVVGIESDVSVPNTIVGSTDLGTAKGRMTSQKSIQASGTLRGRVGYSPGFWLVYATAGWAWTSNRFNLVPLTAVAGVDSEQRNLIKHGVVWGIGAEFALSRNWTAKVEYLHTRFGETSVAFPLLGQRIDVDYAAHGARVGFTHRLDDRRILTDGLGPLETDWFSLRGQTTYAHQYAAPFRAPYSGRNSLIANQGRQTWDVTLYAGIRPWEGGEVWINPEIDQGFGLSSTLGVAGFTSGEAYKVGASVPYARIPRAFFRQTFNLGGESKKIDGDINQFASAQADHRVVVTIGKFSVADVFDTNKYAHDPRKDFMNWSVLDTGTFDYAADAWGYTYGAAIEWYRGAWTVRGGLFDLSKVPNSSELDPRFEQFQWVGEIEHRHDIWGRSGKIAVTGFLSRGRMGRFDQAVQLANANGTSADTIPVRRYRSRAGVSVNLEQEITKDLGVFARAGIADGSVESYEFTDIDKTVAAGLSLTGSSWNRPTDTFGLAGVLNSISNDRKAYLDAGGYGILVGDGRLPNPGYEKIIETYYSFPLLSWRATLNYQFIANPAYNRDRGPVSVLGGRLRAQF
jgi:high affinity Mn2+ porin